jgi:hypothetical protein
MEVPEILTAPGKQFGFTEIPADAARITEEEFERLPDYVLELINQSAEGALPVVTPEELVTVQSAFFAAPIEAVPVITPHNPEHIVIDLTNPEPTSEVVVVKNERCDGDHSISGGEVHSLE